MIKKSVCVLLLSMIFLSGCISRSDYISHGESGNAWTVSEVVAELEQDDDPWEGFNRTIFEIQYYFMFYLVQPVGTVYSSVVPRFFQRGVANVSKNLEYPRRLFANLVQGKAKNAGVETVRFLTNTTVGIGGFFDVSGIYMHLHAKDEDFGQSFEYYGTASGPTLLVPGIFGTNLRDAATSIFDYALDGKTYIPYAGSANALNSTSTQYRQFIRLMRNNYDPYEAYKIFKVIQRSLQYRDFAENRMEESLNKSEIRRMNETDKKNELHWNKPETEIKGYFISIADYKPEHPKLDTMRNVFFSPQDDEGSFWEHLSFWNQDFSNLAKIRKLKIYPDKAAMHYAYWPQKKILDAPLLIILPGIGSHYSAPTAMAFAEMFYQRQRCQTVILSSALNWQFFMAGIRRDFPGETRLDAEDVRKVLQKVLEDVIKWNGTPPREVVLSGFSLGALHTLHIAELERRHPKLSINKYIAINPQIDMAYAVKTIDDCVANSNHWTHREALDYAPAAMGEYFYVSAMPHPYFSKNGKYPSENYRLNLNLSQANFLSGVSFKMTLRDILAEAVRKHGSLNGITAPYQWSNRTRLYREIDKINFSEYIEKFVLPNRENRTESPTDLFYQSGLYPLESTLKNNPNIYVMHNLDDFLIDEKGKKFLDDTMRERLFWFDHGGHLGNMYTETFQDVVINEIFLKKGDRKAELWYEILQLDVCLKSPEFKSGAVEKLMKMPQADLKRFLQSKKNTSEPTLIYDDVRNICLKSGELAEVLLKSCNE